MTEKKIDEAKLRTPGCTSALNTLVGANKEYAYLAGDRDALIEKVILNAAEPPSTRVADPLADARKQVVAGEKVVTRECGASPAEIVKHNYQKIKGPQ